MFENIKAEDWEEEILSERREILRNKHNSLRFEIDYIPETNDLNFEIYDGDNMLGAMNHFAPTIRQWKETFVYNGGFNIFLSNQRIQPYS